MCELERHCESGVPIRSPSQVDPPPQLPTGAAMSNPPNTQETPLLGQRTLLSAAAALGTSRLPMSLRKPGGQSSLGEPAARAEHSVVLSVCADGSSQPAAVTMTAGRLRGALTSPSSRRPHQALTDPAPPRSGSAVGGSKLPLRRPSVSGAGTSCAVELRDVC